MPARKLYLAAYDITEPQRLERMLRVIKDYATGGQKSAYECFLDETEKRRLVQRVREHLDLGQDRFALIRLQKSRGIRLIGKARRPLDPGFFLLQ